MRSLALHTTLTVLCLYLSSCDSNDTSIGWDKAKEIYNAETNDVEMIEAMRESRRTIDTLINTLHSSDTSAHNFAVKYGFQADGFREHIWLSNLLIKNDTIYGVVDNEPEYTTLVSKGQKVAVHKDSISDWNFTRNDNLVGGYSIRVIRNRLSPEKRIHFDETTGWNFE